MECDVCVEIRVLSNETRLSLRIILEPAIARLRYPIQGFPRHMCLLMRPTTRGVACILASVFFMRYIVLRHSAACLRESVFVPLEITRHHFCTMLYGNPYPLIEALRPVRLLNTTTVRVRQTMCAVVGVPNVVDSSVSFFLHDEGKMTLYFDAEVHSGGGEREGEDVPSIQRYKTEMKLSGGVDLEKVRTSSFVLASPLLDTLSSSATMRVCNNIVRVVPRGLLPSFQHILCTAHKNEIESDLCIMTWERS